MAKKLILGALVLVAAFLIAGLVVPRRPEPAQFRTETVVRGELVSTVSATGTLAAVVTVQVGTQVSGTIKELLVDFNSAVRKGQVIARIDPSLFEAKVKEARGNYEAAQANRDKARVDLADAERTLERFRQLFDDGIVSRADLDATETKFHLAEAALAAAESAVTQNLGQYEQAQTNLRYASITAPSDGVVISRNVDVGQTVAASFQTPTLFTIAKDLTKMEIQTSVDEADISRVAVGQPVTFTVDAHAERTFTGAVTQIRQAPILTQNVVTYIVIVGVENEDLKLMPGMTADVTIEAVRRENVLKVPSAALRFKPEDGGAADAGAAGEKVYVLRAGAPVLVPVQTGITGDGFVEVVSSGSPLENEEVILEQLSEKKSAPRAVGPVGPGF